MWKSLAEKNLQKNLHQQLQQSHRLCHNEAAALWDRTMSQLARERKAKSKPIWQDHHCPKPMKKPQQPCHMPHHHHTSGGGSMVRLAVCLLFGAGVALVGARLRHELM